MTNVFCAMLKILIQQLATDFVESTNKVNTTYITAIQDHKKRIKHSNCKQNLM